MNETIYLPSGTYTSTDTITVRDDLLMTSIGSSTTWDIWVKDQTSSYTTSINIHTNWITSGQTFNGNVIVSPSDSLYPSDASIEERIQRIRQAAEQQRIAENERRIAARERSARLAAEMQQANDKAKIILVETLNNNQRRDFERHGHFFVKSPSGRLYRIREGRSINIDLMQGESRTKVQQRLCAHPDINCPNPDTMLVQKVMLENMEAEFLRIANQYDPVRH